MLLLVLCSMLGDLIIPVDCLSIIVGMGLSIILKAGVKLPGWLWGAIAQRPGHLQLRQEVLGSIPSGCPVFFFSSSWLTNVDGMKKLVL